VLNSYVKKEAIAAAGGKFTPEQEEAWAREHSNLDFRQSGHLPDLHQLDQEAEKEQAKSLKESAHHVSSSHSEPHKENSTKPVHSSYEGDAHHDNERVVKETYAAAPAIHSEMRALGKEEQIDSATAARGSGFLCCLFFRKIVIM